MRVVQINSHFGKGGAGKIVQYLHNEMENDGIDITSIYGRDSGTLCETKNVIRIGTNFSNAIDASLTRLSGFVGAFSKNPTNRAIRLIDEKNPDLVHLHVLHGYYINQNLLLKHLIKRNVPIVWTLHDCSAFTGKCGYSYECEKYKENCGGCPYLKDYPKVLFWDRTKQLLREKREIISEMPSLTVVSPCDWMTELAKGSLFYNSRCITINNGIETRKAFVYRDKMVCRKELKLPSGPIALGVAYGQEDPRKGVKYIIEAAKRLKEISFVLIGVSEHDRFLFEGLNNVIVRGFISDNVKLSYYYNAADVYLLPSLAENYATTVLESQACGTPVVGFEVGGVPEQLEGIFGTAVERDNQEMFNRQIIKYCMNPYDGEMRKSLSEMTEKRNSIHTMYTKYKEVYKELLEKV